MTPGQGGVGQREVLTVAAEERAQRRGGRRADLGVGTGVAGVQRRRCQRRPRGIAGGVRVAVVVGRLHRGDRTPAMVGVLRVVQRDHAVGHAGVEHREHPRVLRERVVVRHARRLGDLVPDVLHGRGAPELADLRLLVGPRGAVHLTQRLDLVEVRGVAGRGHGRRCRRPELVTGAERERPHGCPVREHGLLEARRRELILARARLRSERRGCGRRAVVGACGEDGLGGVRAHPDALADVRAATDLGERVLVLRIDRRLLAGEQRQQDGVRGRRRRCIGRRRARSRVPSQVRGIAALDGVDRVVDGQLRDGQAAGGMDGGGLRARCLEQLKQGLVPLGDLVGLAGGAATAHGVLGRGASAGDGCEGHGRQEDGERRRDAQRCCDASHGGSSVRLGTDYLLRIVARRAVVLCCP